MLGISQVSVQIITLYTVEWVVSSSDLFFNCLQFHVSILKSLVCELCIVLTSKC